MLRKIFYIIPLLLAIAFAQESLTSLPIEPLLDGPIELAELGSSTATLRINTSLDVACVVVYGTDKSFGNMALDADMGADAHANHRVVMRGLSPDTEYFYRFQGSDRNGNFYLSKVMSFRTEVEAAKTDIGENIALISKGASIVDVSSNYANGANDSSWGANNAIDGNPNTQWSSNSDGDSAFITVKLPEQSKPIGFGLWTRTMGDSAQISSFEVVNEFADVYGPFEIANADSMFQFRVDARGSVFSFRVIKSSGGNTGVVDLAIYK